MERRQYEPDERQDGDWNAQDVAEYNGIKQVGILWAISPLITFVSATLLVVIPGSFPVLRVAAFIAALTSLMGAGAWFAGYLSRLGQAGALPLAAPSPANTRRPWGNAGPFRQGQRVVVRIVRPPHAPGTTRAVPPARVRVRSNSAASGPASRLAA